MTAQKVLGAVKPPKQIENTTKTVENWLPGRLAINTSFCM